ncbi:MAG TPA: NAD(P)H-hydrate epimerase [Actinomycetota bacterium]|nr:NAD(P)H-hydrate epimerase [Actinomycetota bacterium]
MQPVHDVPTIRTAEEALMARMTAGALMQRAATGLAVRTARLMRAHYGGISGLRLAVVAGSGNNGGDALFAASQLARRGVAVDILPTSDTLHEAGLRAARREGARVRAPRRADVVLDAVVGIGGTGPLRDNAAAIRDTVEAELTIAVDLPSGLQPDTGDVPGQVWRADHTVTFGTLKPGVVLRPDVCGQVHLVDIGLDATLPPATVHVVQRADAAEYFPRPGFRDHKYTRGVVSIAAGSQKYPGAGQLCTAGARHADVGMVRSAVGGFPDVVVADGRTDAYVVGPGLADAGRLEQAVAQALGSGRPVVLDAEALAHAAPGPVVITPHEGEFARLGFELGSDRIAAVRAAAAQLQVVVLLKGAVTVVAEPGGQVFVNTHSDASLSTAGSGDVLSGLLGGMLARSFVGREPDLPGMARLAACAALVHGQAGALAAFPATSVDVAQKVAAAVAWAAEGASPTTIDQ